MPIYERKFAWSRAGASSGYILIAIYIRQTVCSCL